MSWIEFARSLSPNLGHSQLDQNFYQGRLVYLNSSKADLAGLKLSSWHIVDNEKFSSRHVLKTIGSTPQDYQLTGISVVYNNYITVFGTSKAAKEGVDFSMFVCDLGQVWGKDSFSVNILGSSEERKFKSLYAQSRFTKPDDAEVVMFRVQDKLIPIHTNVLMKRSKHFAQIVKSNF